MNVILAITSLFWPVAALLGMAAWDERNHKESQ